MTPLSWTDQDFDSMSWHDNHVHALRIVEGQHGAGELLLDLDYIVEWVKGDTGMQFRIVPAELRFKEVTDLRLLLDYAMPRAGLTPFSIHAIERKREQRDRYVAQLWKIFVNWPAGEITFEAAGYEQHSTGAPVLSDLQYLKPEQRNVA